jgi:hypothetical protein
MTNLVKQYATYKVLGGNIKIVGEVEDTDDGVTGFLYMVLNNGAKNLLCDTGSTCVTVKECWEVIDEEFVSFTDYGFVRMG